MPEKLELAERMVLGICLAFFIASGLNDAIVYRQSQSVYWIATLLIALPLLVIASKRVAELGAIGLIACAGFLVILANYLFVLLDGYDWFEGHWYFTPAWFRLATYFCLGSLVVKHKGFWFGSALSLVVALTDALLDFLVFIPSQQYMAGAQWWKLLQATWLTTVTSMAGQAVVLAFVSLIGGVIGIVYWRWLSQPTSAPEHKGTR
jgi:hypothetical protein